MFSFSADIIMPNPKGGTQYDTSAFGIWIVAFLFFAAFFIKEIHFIITIRKEGKMYGIIT